MRLIPLCIVALLNGTLIAAPSPEGLWIGTGGFPPNQQHFSIEFLRAPNGLLSGNMTIPEVHTLGQPLGPVTQTGEALSIPGGRIKLIRTGDGYAGHFGPLQVPVTLRRSKEPLPTDAVPADVPAGPAPRVIYRTRAGFWTTPQVDGGAAYLGSADGAFHAIGIADGRVLWTRQLAAPVYGDALVTGDRVFVVDDSGVLHALARATGEARWNVELGKATVPRSMPAMPSEWDYRAPQPALAGETLFTGSPSGAFFALDAATGSLRWKFETGAKIRATAAVAGDRVIIGSMNGTVHALDQATGRELWRHATLDSINTPIVAAGDLVLIASRDCELLALRVADGSVAWRVYYWTSWVESAPRVMDSVLYVGSSDARKAYAFDLTSGRQLWSSELGGWAWASPAVTGNTVYLGTAGTADYQIPQRASFSAINRKTGELRWRREFPGIPGQYLHGFVGSPVATGREVIIAGLDGSLLAFPQE